LAPFEDPGPGLGFLVSGDPLPEVRYTLEHPGRSVWRKIWRKTIGTQDAGYSEILGPLGAFGAHLAHGLPTAVV
jgi:hypothetical protein